MSTEGGHWDNGEVARAHGTDRRTFLGIGVGCALPLLVGGALRTVDAGTLLSTNQPPNDHVFEHVQRELLAACQSAKGPAGIRGEHVRTVAVNLDLVGMHLHRTGHAARADRAFEARIRERGRGSVLQDLDAMWSEARNAITTRHGLAHVADLDPAVSLGAMDEVTAKGVVRTLRAPRVHLSRLAAWMDRPGGQVCPYPRMVTVGQKPGDDFLGYPELQVPDMSWCEFLTALVCSIELTVLALGMIVGGSSAAGWAAAGVILDYTKEIVCARNMEP